MNALKTFAGAALALSIAIGGAQAQVLFWSTQARPVEETQKMRSEVLKTFDGEVDYQVAEDGPWLTRLQAELQAGSGTIGVLHGDFSTVGADLVDLSGVDVGGVKLNEAYKKLGMLGTSEQKYLPWMQATFLMAANKQALQYLPAGTDLNT
ncbi:MAG: carbohydrate ABC transporter substrate-binding protein, partial [Mesorhizobium sp.]